MSSFSINRTVSRRTRVLAVVLGAALAGSLSAGIALTGAAQPAAKSTSMAVEGTLADHPVTKDCPSSFCMEGTYLTGKIRGPFRFEMTKVTQTDAPGVVFYVANGVIHTKGGDVHCSDFGIQNLKSDSAGEGVQLCEVTGGTGDYEGATGYLQDRFFLHNGDGHATYKGLIRR